MEPRERWENITRLDSIQRKWGLSVCHELLIDRIMLKCTLFFLYWISWLCQGVAPMAALTSMFHIYLFLKYCQINDSFKKFRPNAKQKKKKKNQRDFISCLRIAKKRSCCACLHDYEPILLIKSLSSDNRNASWFSLNFIKLN